MATNTTTIRISAIDDASAIFKKIGGAAAQLSARLNKIGTMTQLAGFRVSAALGYPMTRAVKGMVNAARGYENAVNRLSAVAAVQRSALAESEKAARQLAKTTIFSATEVVQAQFELVQSGLSLQQSQAALAPTLQLATMAQMDLAQAASTTTDVMLGYGLQVSDLSRINDILAFQATKSNSTVEQLTQGFRHAGPVASQLGISFEKTAAMLGVLADAGFKGSQGGTALRTIMLRLISPTNKARAALESLNIDASKFASLKAPPTGQGLAKYIASQGLASTRQLAKMTAEMDRILKNGGANGKSRGQAINDLLINRLGLKGAHAKSAANILQKYLLSIADGIDVAGLFEELKKRGASAAQLNDIFGVRRTAQAITLMQKMDKVLAQTRKNIVDSAGASAEMASKMMLGPEGAIKRLQAALENLALSFWDSGLGDAVLHFIDGMRNVVNYLSSLPKETKMAIAKFAMFVTAIGPVLIYVGLVTQGIGALVGGMSMLTRLAAKVGPALFGLSAALVRLPIKTVAASFGFLTRTVLSLMSAGRLLMLSPLVLIGTAAFFSVQRAIDMTSKTLGKYSPLLIRWRDSLKHIFTSSYHVVSRFLMGDVRGAGSAKKMLIYELTTFRDSSIKIMQEIGNVAIPAIFGADNAGRAMKALNRIAENLKRIFEAATAAAVGFAEGFASAFSGVDKISGFMGSLSESFAGATTAIVEMIAAITGVPVSTEAVGELAMQLGALVGEGIIMGLKALFWVIKKVAQGVTLLVKGVRAIPGIVRAIPDAIRYAFDMVRQWFADVQQWFSDLKDSIIAKFKSIGSGIADAIKGPLEGIADWFIGKFNLILKAVNAARGALGYDPIQLIQTNAERRAVEAPTRRAARAAGAAAGGAGRVAFIGPPVAPNARRAYGPPMPPASRNRIEPISRKYSIPPPGAANDKAMRVLEKALNDAFGSDKAKTDVNIKVTTDKGVSATGSAVSHGPVSSHLNIGESSMVPF